MVERLALQVAKTVGSETPVLNSCELTIFAADHGLVEEGVSAFPQAVTREMVLNFLRGGAAANVFARTVGATVRVVDAGVAGEKVDHADLIDRRVAPGTANSRREPAMTAAQRDAALKAGRDLVSGSAADVLCFGEMGIGNTSAATLIAHKVLSLPVADLTGRGTGLDDDGLARKTAILEGASERTAASLSAEEALAEYGGFEIAMMAGAMMEGVRRGRPVLVDGFISSSAAICALHLAPEIHHGLIFTHQSAEQGHRLVLETLQVQPVLNLEMRLGEGTGALLAWPIVRSAAAMLTEMASFADAGVSGPV